MKRFGFFKGAPYITVFLFSMLFCLRTTAQSPVLQIGDQAPALEIARWVKGTPVQQFEKGKIYVVEFWATWCAPCIAGMPHLSELARQYKGKVEVAGISILERGENIEQRVERFVNSMGNKMDYHVAMEKEKRMAQNWLYASGERGIPQAYIVDRQGKIAWVGHPKKLDKVLPEVMAGTWNMKEAAGKRKEWKRLSAIDGQQVVSTLNPYMGNPGRPVDALLEIEKILKEEPGLKYYPKLGHFTFYSLLKTNPSEAVAFAKKWFTESEEPSWKTITDAVRPNMDYPKEVYELAAESYQAQLDNYPWSMNFSQTYRSMAELYRKAGDTAKAAIFTEKAAAAEKLKPQQSGTH